LQPGVLNISTLLHVYFPAINNLLKTKMSRQKHRSSQLCMDEDVYLLTKSFPSLPAYDDETHHDSDATHPTALSSHALTPKMETRRKAPRITSSAIDSDRMNTSHNRLNAISTIISSLFGGTGETFDAQNSRTSSGSSHKSGKGIYRFFHNDFSNETNIILILCYILVLLYSILICAGPIFLAHIVPAEEWCGLSSESVVERASSYANPDYITDPCRYLRVPRLFYLTLEECDMSRRLLCSVFLGGVIGYERRSADRPAGIRCMGLVSLGAASFTISSIMAFRSSPMGWDASRVTAALPSGIGFLGGALIWKGSVFVSGVGEVHQVNGLTTAASVWLSAAVGVGSGGGLYLVTIYVVILVIMILRYAPRSYLIGLDVGAEANERTEEVEVPAEQKTTGGNARNGEEEELRSQERIMKMLSESFGNDIEENEEMDTVGLMRNTSSRGLLEGPEFPSPPKPQRSPSNQMNRSRSTGYLRASLRAQVPTFGE
jgi:uncharacterized membrane protein YhiD involved in acid resistance